jgi:hypothetical protein
MTDIIAVKNPKYLMQYDRRSSIGIPTDFWVAKKGAFAKGTLPVMLYSHYGNLYEVTISDNPELMSGWKNYETSMLFKLVRRTIIRLQDELIQIWNGADDKKVFCGINKFPPYWEMTKEQRQVLNALNQRLFDIEKSIYEKYEQIQSKYPDEDLTCEINFVLSENDPEWDDEDDNILTTLEHHQNEEYNPSGNWNDCPHLIKDEKGKPEHLCWLFHELYDHSGLAWDDLLRIGTIRAEMKLTFDYEY